MQNQKLALRDSVRTVAEKTYLLLEAVSHIREGTSPKSSERNLFGKKSYEANRTYPDRQGHFRKREREAWTTRTLQSEACLVVVNGGRNNWKVVVFLGVHVNIFGD